MPAPDTSATKPWVIAPPPAPRPDATKTRSPVLIGGLEGAKSSLGTLPRLSTINARSRLSSHVHSVPFWSVSPWRIRTPPGGPGSCVAARTVLYDVSSSVWSASDATAKAEPTDGWPASSSVDTKKSESLTLVTSRSSVSPSAWMRLIGSSSLSISALALAVSASIVFWAVSKRLSKPVTKRATRRDASSFLNS